MLFCFFVFVFGTCVGSFLNSVVYRLQENQSFFVGRSYCPKCKHKLNWQDLIPLLSFFYLKGKCRYCGEKIALQYPLVEFLTGLLFVFVTRYGLLLKGYSSYNLLLTVYYLLITCFLIIIFLYDLKHYIIPDKVIYPAIGTVFLYRLFEILEFGNWDLFRIWDLGFGILRPIVHSFSAGLGALAFFLAIVLVSRGKWMGLGDVKMAFFMGSLLGAPALLVALFSAFFIGAIIGIGLIIFKKKTLKSEIPFGPFLVAGTFLAMFWGDQIVGWYLNLLNFTI